MAKVDTVAGLKALVSSHINSIADAFFSLGGERSPDFVLGLTTLDEAFAFSSRSSSRQWIAYLRQHKLVSSEGAPPFIIFEHNLARPGDLFQLRSLSPAAAVDILLRACSNGSASTDFEAAVSKALSRSSPNPDIANQAPYISLAEVNTSVMMVVIRFCLGFSCYSLA